jgi:hypothetical protein
MTAVFYTQWHTLSTRGAVDPGPEEGVDGVLLVATEVALTFSANQNYYGEDAVYILPAFHNGDHCWIRREVWCPEFGYSASGTQEFIISFEEGVKLFLERGIFEFPVEKYAKEEESAKAETCL